MEKTLKLVADRKAKKIELKFAMEQKQVKPTVPAKHFDI